MEDNRITELGEKQRTKIPQKTKVRASCTLMLPFRAILSPQCWLAGCCCIWTKENNSYDEKKHNQVGFALLSWGRLEGRKSSRQEEKEHARGEQGARNCDWDERAKGSNQQKDHFVGLSL